MRLILTALLEVAGLAGEEVEALVWAVSLRWIPVCLCYNHL